MFVEQTPRQHHEIESHLQPTEQRAENGHRPGALHGGVSPGGPVVVRVGEQDVRQPEQHPPLLQATGFDKILAVGKTPAGFKKRHTDAEGSE